MTITIEEVAEDIGKTCQKKFEYSPVSTDLPRLARTFVIQKYNENSLEKVNFTENIKTDKLEKVIHGLIGQLLNFLNPSNNIISPSFEDFQKEVNLSITETLGDYLLKHYGEATPLNRMLKACNQAVTITALGHIRKALTEKEINFKDCRGCWNIYFHTGKNQTTPTVLHKRKEQVFRFTKEGGLDNLFKFEWEIEITFDSLEIKQIKGIGLRIASIEMDSEILKEEEKEMQIKVMNEALKELKLTDLSISLLDNE
jgi:hypothetical protein